MIKDKLPFLPNEPYRTHKITQTNHDVKEKSIKY